MTDNHLDSINIHHFKAFKEFQLKLEGRHLLIYGANGSGKSSLYWALYTFLESAGKSTDEIQKYFDPRSDQSLVNIYASTPENETAFIKLTLKDDDTEETLKISNTQHQTKNNAIIAKASLASDFITYRFFFKFADFRNSQDFDIWELFEREILPFCRTTSGTDLNVAWQNIKTDLPHTRGLLGGGAAKAYDEFSATITTFNIELSSVIDTIATKTNEFYSEHFSGDETELELALGITTSATYDKDTKVFNEPKLKLSIKAHGVDIPRPQVFLNEAKLTQVAMSIRFAASLVNLNRSSIKLLVLDDLLVSLDLDNRMKVVKILLSETFDNYQKIILTHDLGFFREFRRMIGGEHSKWCFRKLQGNPKDGINIKEKKSSTEKAEDYIRKHDLEEASVCLRKAAEDTIKQYRELTEGIRIGSEKFVSLTNQLEKAKSSIKARIPERLFERVLMDLDPELLSKLIAYTDDDIESDPGFDDDTKDMLKNKRQDMKNFLSSDGWRNFQDFNLLDQILQTTERVLNPASHWGEPTLYEAEVQNALDLIRELENCLEP